MSWLKITFDNHIKEHIVHESIADSVVADIAERHKAQEVAREGASQIHFDPGGMFQLDREDMSFEVDGLTLSINEQHIWALSPQIEYSSRSRAGSVKVNIPSMFKGCCVVMPPDIYSLFKAEIEQLNMRYDAKHGEDGKYN